VAYPGIFEWWPIIQSNYYEKWAAMGNRHHHKKTCGQLPNGPPPGYATASNPRKWRSELQMGWAGRKKTNPWAIVLLIGSAHGRIFKKFSTYGSEL